MQKAIGFLAMIVIGLCLPSCSSVSSYNIKVNGYTDPGTPAEVKPGGSFCVIENKEAKNPLLEAEVKGKITKLLVTRGYPVTTFEKADYYLFFGYGMGEPRSVNVATPDYYGSIGWGMGYGVGRPVHFRGDALRGLPGRRRHPLRPLAADQAWWRGPPTGRRRYHAQYGWGKPTAWAPPRTSAPCSTICWWRISRSSAKIPAKP